MPTTHRRRIRDPRVRLVRGQVGQRSGDSRGVVFKQADGGIASGAEKAAYRAGLMVMIYCQAFLYACIGLNYAQAIADSAHAILSFVKRVVFGWFNTESLFALRISAGAVVLLAVIGAPLSLLISTARATESLKSVDLPSRFRKVGQTLHGLASAAPLHSIGRFRAARSKAVVPSQVIHGFALDPSPVRSVPGSNRRWSATSALASAFRYFGHHAFPSHWLLPTISKVKSNG